MNTCQYCNKPLVDCLRQYEASIYSDSVEGAVCDKTFTNINDAITWALSMRADGYDFLRIYQGCDREHEVYQQYL